MKLLIFLLILLTFRVDCDAQIKRTDTVLYLAFDKGNQFVNSTNSGSNTRIYSNGIYKKFEHDPGFHRMINRTINPPDRYIIRDLTFVGRTKDGYDKISSDVVKLSELKKIRIVSISELEGFLKYNYKERSWKEFMDTTLYIEPRPRDPLGVVSFWSQLKHIYIIEKDIRKKLATITEVDLDLDVE